MVIGYRNAPRTFQRSMNVILSCVKWQLPFANLADIGIFRKTPEQLDDHVCKILLLQCDTGATLKRKNWNTFSNTFNYLGHDIRPRCKKLVSTTQRLLSAESSGNFFLGFSNVFRQFVASFAQIAFPPNRRLKKSEPKTFALLKGKEVKAKGILQDALKSPPVLAHPIFLDIRHSTRIPAFYRLAASGTNRN